MSTLHHYEQTAGRPMLQGPGRRSSPLSWRWTDRLALAMAWGAGILLCLIAGAIVIYFCVRGIQYIRPSLLLSRPQAGPTQAGTGGFLDPILGTALLTLIGVLLATPLAVTAALWIVEYGRPSWLARVVETTIEIVAGTPDILIALFGLTVFQLHLLAPFSFTAAGGGVYGRSFIAAGIVMSLIAVPAIYTATRDGLQAVPAHMREAAYALGKTKVATIRRVLLPSVRSNIATGVTLGISRIIGDTAIIIFVLGVTLRNEAQNSVPIVGALRGTGSTLTSYIFENSPAGEGGAPQKAYAAAFVLLVFVMLLNLLVGRIGRSQADSTGLTVAGAVV